MSAFLVSNHEVNVLASYAARHGLGQVTEDTAAAVALRLWEDNATGLRGRYGERAGLYFPESLVLGQLFSYEPVDDVTPQQALDVAATYRYQCSAAPQWSESLGYLIGDLVGDHAWRLGARIYQDGLDGFLDDGLVADWIY